MELSYSLLGTDLGATFTLTLLVVAGLVVVLVDAFSANKRTVPILTGLVFAVGLVWEVMHLYTPTSTAWWGMVRTGGYAAFVNVILLLSALLTVMLSDAYLERIRHNYGEVYALLLFATAGMITLGTANNLVMIFVGLETMSVCLYILTGLIRDDEGGIESALKYFLLGAFSTGFFLYGIALLYGATGTMYLPEMGLGLEISGANVMFWAGAALLFIGFLFKVSAAPFHMWTPDVYQGAPTTITGFMATASKASAFAALILVLASAVPGTQWQMALAVVALITMVVGNVLALVQRNVKRLLAYSSIAHAGYVLVGLAAGTPEAYGGALFYLLVYAIMNVGAFGVMAYLEWDGKTGREQTLESLAGLGRRYPVLGVTMGIFMFSLAGFPPLAGFLGKYAVFAPAVQAGLTWLVIIGVLTSAISAAYYLRVLVYLFMQPKEEGVERTFPALPLLPRVALVVCAALLIVLMFAPTLLGLAGTFYAPGLDAMAVTP